MLSFLVIRDHLEDKSTGTFWPVFRRIGHNRYEIGFNVLCHGLA